VVNFVLYIASYDLGSGLGVCLDLAREWVRRRELKKLAMEHVIDSSWRV
jgi:hypothetical protein